MGSDFVNGNVTPWCASFVSWCAKEAGFIDSGIVPKAASVRAYHRFYEEKGRFHSASGNYREVMRLKALILQVIAIQNIQQEQQLKFLKKWEHIILIWGGRR